MHQAQNTFVVGHAQSKENPELKLIFLRLARFLPLPISLIFVFDGPERPGIKRRKRVAGPELWLTQGMQKFIEAFGFRWTTAPGEAEAELACMNARGVIDAVMTEDSDAFVFGAKTVIRVPNIKRDGDNVVVYTADAICHKVKSSLTRGGFLLAALISGGDYIEKGLPGGGCQIATGLASYGLGESLLAAASLSYQDLEVFLRGWREEVRRHLRHDLLGYIGRRYPALADKLPDTFPDIRALRSYANPTVSDFDSQPRSSLPNPAKLAELCEHYFTWGSEPGILLKFRDIIWPGLVFRAAWLQAVRDEGNAAQVGGGGQFLAAEGLISLMTVVRLGTFKHIPSYKIRVLPASIIRGTTALLHGTRETIGIAQESTNVNSNTKSKKRRIADVRDPLDIWIPAIVIARVSVLEDSILALPTEQPHTLTRMKSRTVSDTRSLLAAVDNGFSSRNVHVPAGMEKRDEQRDASGSKNTVLWTGDVDLAESMEPLLMESQRRLTPFPIQYHEIWQMYKEAEKSTWTSKSVDSSIDLYDWKYRLNDNERHFVSHILAFFTTFHGLINRNLVERFSREVQIPEARSFYALQIMMQNVHSETYSLLIDTYVNHSKQRDHLFDAINSIPSIKKKAQWALTWISDQHATFAERLVAFAAVESIMFSGSFASIYWLNRWVVMPGLTISNKSICCDERMYADFACILFKHLKSRPHSDMIKKIIMEAVNIEVEFFTDALPVELIGMNADTMCQYIQFVADRLLVALGNDKAYESTNPFDFMENISHGKATALRKQIIFGANATISNAGVVTNLPSDATSSHRYSDNAMSVSNGIDIDGLDVPTVAAESTSDHFDGSGLASASGSEFSAACIEDGTPSYPFDLTRSPRLIASVRSDDDGFTLDGGDRIPSVEVSVDIDLTLGAE